MEIIFGKTSKGHAEIRERKGELNIRLRRILILVDGQRSVEDLGRLTRSDDLATDLCILESQDYIGAVDINHKVGRRDAIPLSAKPTESPREKSNAQRLYESGEYENASAAGYTDLFE